jgi:two-component system NtrC family sensor kinase
MVRRLRAAAPLNLLLIVSILVPALLFAVIALVSYRTAFNDAERELVWTSEIARAHAAKVFDSYRLVAGRVLDAVSNVPDAEIRRDEERYHNRFMGVIRDLPQIQSFIVVDATGHALFATGAYPVSRTDDFSDRDYFQALKSGDADTFIGRVQISRITGKEFFGWGRARRLADGAFDGAIDIAVSPDFFMNFYGTLVSEVGDDPLGRVVSMIREDGQLLVRYPALGRNVSVVPKGNPFFDAVRKNPNAGIYRNRSIVDDNAPERLFAFRKVEGHPIYIVAGRSIAAIVGEWRNDMTRYLALGAPATLALFLVTLAAARGAARERNALLQLREEMGRRERAEDQLRQSQKMEAVGQLTGGIAHDFNNLLTVIRSSIDLLARPDLPEERRKRYVAAISDTTTRAAKLTGQLLAFARRQALKPEVFDVVQNVASITEMVRTLCGSRIVIQTVLPAASVYVNADASQFDTSIVNMAVNARDAMSGEGRLTISVRIVDGVPAVRGHAATPGEYVAIAIADTGVGIPGDRIDRIFEPFFTTKGVGQGTGLGLSQVFGFAKQSGGDTTVESEVGRGATFTLYLPRVAAPLIPKRADDDPRAAPADGHGARVLVVEDNADVAAFATQSLAELGYDAVRVANAEEALAELGRNAETYDVVFSDVVMPGMNGVDLGREIRRRHGDLPVVLTSGYSHVLATNNGAGFELLQKPYSVEQLARVLRKIARRPLRSEASREA